MRELYKYEGEPGVGKSEGMLKAMMPKGWVKRLLWRLGYRKVKVMELDALDARGFQADLRGIPVNMPLSKSEQWDREDQEAYDKAYADWLVFNRYRDDE